MNLNILLILPLMLIMSLSLFPTSFASVESEAQEDIEAGCRGGQTLVYRLAYQDYICVDPSTAERWEELGLAEIILKSSTKDADYEKIDSDDSSTPVDVSATPKHSVSKSEDSECRTGYVLVSKFTSEEIFCTIQSTAIFWERLGIAEIIRPDSSNDIEDILLSDIPLEDVETSLSSDDLIEKSESGSEKESDLGDGDSLDNSVETSLSNYPQIFSLDEHFWLIVDSLGTQSIIIEEDDGLIVIDTPNSYESTKKAFEKLNEFSNTRFEELNKFSSKDVKHIILTRNHTGVIDSTYALLEEGDGNVEIILSETLLEYFNKSSDWIFPNTITFGSEFTIDTDLNMELIFVEGNISHQTYIFVPGYDGIIIGDSVYGVAPFILNSGYLKSFFDFVNVPE